MKKIIYLIFFAVFLGNVAAQEAVSLDAAITNAANYLNEKLPNKTKVVVWNFSVAGNQNASNFIVEELTANLVNNTGLVVVDRKNLDLIAQEMNFQLSGEVDEKSMQEAARKLGAETIILGEITAYDRNYRMRIKALSVQTAQVQAMQNQNIIAGGILMSWSSDNSTNIGLSMSEKLQKSEKRKSVVTTVIGGTIFAVSTPFIFMGIFGFYENWVEDYDDRGYYSGGYYETNPRSIIGGFVTAGVFITTGSIIMSKGVKRLKAAKYGQPLTRFIPDDVYLGIEEESVLQNRRYSVRFSWAAF